MAHPVKVPFQGIEGFHSLVSLQTMPALTAAVTLQGTAQLALALPSDGRVLVSNTSNRPLFDQVPTTQPVQLNIKRSSFDSCLSEPDCKLRCGKRPPLTLHASKVSTCLSA